MFSPGNSVDPSLLIPRVEVDAKVSQLAREIDNDYADRSPVIVGILKGSIVFLADLIRRMNTPIHSIEFIRLASYAASTTSSGQPRLSLELSREAIMGRDVIVVDDIVDTGLSTQTAIGHLSSLRPASLALCVLLDKPDRRRVPVNIDYLGFTVPNRFIVGYGIDVGERYRQLPDICTIRE
ncbi:MAG TPA: hypoxanthine phosphoribosyltransferase [Dehalococcoidia bacterium]|jgi:hypoxanthine phosphoribosyltransferase|nr:hypoxanthine phosphoribosyltransferase [SAR202 cluster bacterium]MQG56711.1 hypoxanthine phosphoribosyltransferase [SAR202 cluster bacterium]HAL46399.1 hypoxanthine phosphoribosyltransferase [Dehalococcoidia bacterium]|tara:strand:- start:392 stop:934 length:543 start_codon:yes stop_codon:yes gene_type:complete